MKTIITVSESRSMRGNFKVLVKRFGLAPYSHITDGVEAAAAKAMELAIGCSGPYTIHGDKAVIDEIRSGGISGDSK